MEAGKKEENGKNFELQTEHFISNLNLFFNAPSNF